MKDILDFIHDAIDGYSTFSIFFKREEREDNAKPLIRFGIELNLVNEEGKAVSLNDACNDLIQRYKEHTTSIDYGHSFVSNMYQEFENILFNSNEKQRMYLTRRIVGIFSDLLLDTKVISHYKGLELIEEYGMIYYNEKGTDNEVYVYRTNDTLCAFEAISVIYWLLKYAIEFFITFVYTCYLWEIDLKQTIQDMLGDDTIQNLEQFGISNAFEGLSKSDTLIYGKKEVRLGKENDFNIYRKKEAIIAILEELGVRMGSTGAIPDSQIKKFIYFLTGSGTIKDDIRNTYIADAFKPSKDTRSNATINRDLDFVAARFEDIGLFDLAQKIKNGKN